MNKKSVRLDSYIETEKKIKQWKETSRINGYCSAWELKKVLSKSKYISHIKSFIRTRDINSEYYKSDEDYWLLVLPEFEEEYVCNLMLSVWINEVRKLIDILCKGRTNIILSGNISVLDRQYKENIIIDKKQIQIIFTADKKIPLKANDNKDAIE